MILQQSEHEVVILGEEMETHKMHISKAAENHLIRMATEWSYRSPLESGIRECVSNAIDSHLEAENPDPIIVTLQKNSENKWELEIKDEGLGLDDISFKRYIMGIGESTKRDNPKALGGYGCGSKAFCSYTNSYQYLCRKDGIERKYLIIKGEEVPEDILIYTTDTEEKNGVTVTIPLNPNYGEYDNCVRAIKEQLSYLDNIWYNITSFDNSFKIFKHELFEWNSLHTARELHISLKGIYYPINWDKLGISRIDIPIALRFDDYDYLQPVFNREELIWNALSKEKVLEKIADVADFFVEKYNESVVEPVKFYDYYDKIGSHTKYVQLLDKNFEVSGLAQYASKQFEDFKIKGMSLQQPSWYKSKIHELLGAFHIKAEYTHRGVWKTVRLYTNLEYKFRQKQKVLLTDNGLRGNVKEFVKEKVGTNQIFIAESHPKDLNWYRINILGNVDKENWRKNIVEFQAVQKQMLVDWCEDWREAEKHADYEDWLGNRKEWIKANREKNPTLYKLLNKELGDVTIAYSRKPLIGNIPVFEKAVYKISELYKTPHLVVYFPPEEIEQAKLLADLLVGVKVAIIGKREITKINAKQFINYNTYMGDNKAFRRIATSLLAKEVVEKYDRILHRNNEIVNSCVKHLKDDREALQIYINANYTGASNSALEAIRETAKDLNLFDEEIMPILRRLEKGIETFQFLQYIEEPRSWDEEKKKEITKLINQMLLFRKKYYNELENYELIYKEPILIEDNEPF